ncbi:MAG: pyruvate carboxylase [Firmicutes bacterium]|nr:pyruvate carboxylase [Bacillota bacterium]
MITKKIKKVLAANRGEIAIRIFRACNDLGIRTVAIYSKEDKYNLFRTKADESYLIGEDKSPLGAYLDIDAIIKLALEKGVDAIHPGYGFLSENANFARACEKAGIIFIGPPSHVLDKMGDKLNAKEIAKKCHVPTIPGTDDPLTGANEAVKKANEYGYPVILKAAAGGGGRGMRRCNNDAELQSAFEVVQREALKSFGNGDIFMEKYLVEPKHIEIQILADKHNNVVHLYERDCSLQRRYQKVIEFAPAVSLPKETLNALYADAVKISKSVDYVAAGTVEFLVDNSGRHYFIEMNPRIQVEHTVTEVVTGVDLVQAQILVAEGHKLSDSEIGIANQDAIQMSGYAIQCRVTTEDPRNNFAPDTGKISVYRSGGGNGVRLDAGNAYTGAEISPYYDSLLVKVTTFDRTFEGAKRKAMRTLGEMRLRGVKHNIQFLSNILVHPVFASGDCNTSFIDNTPELFLLEEPKDRATKILNYIADVIVNGKNKEFRYVGDMPSVPQSGAIKKGLKQTLDKKGPAAVAEYVLKNKKLMLADTTLRDAHQSLLATRVRTKDMAAIADYMAHSMPNLFALEMWGGATFDVAYRFLHESPWERLEILRKKIPNTLFMMLLRGANAVGYTNYPDNVVREFVKESAKAGIDVFRVFDSLNWMPNVEVSIDEVLNQNKICEGYICYTGNIDDPNRDKYGLKYYVDLAKQMEKMGVHILGIKDMAGLLKPYAAYKLVKTLKQEVGMPIHFHTHDTSGNGVASVLKAAEAGVDIVDTAIASLSSLSSQPSMNAIVTALEGQKRDTGFEDQKLLPISDYWHGVRKLYGAFEADLTSPTTDIYRYEIPGGQYSNLKPQVEDLGLGKRFNEVKEMYKVANDLLGDIVKVTPSSKMVGDLAIFMVQNELTPDNIVKKGKNLAFPESVVSYFEGYMGQPQGGFPPELQKTILKGKTPITVRPGTLLPPADFAKVKTEIAPYITDPTMQDMVSYVLYPKVVGGFWKHRDEFSDLSCLNTDVFFFGLEPGEMTRVDIEDGKTLYIKLISISDADEESNYCNVVFDLNGVRREIAVRDVSKGEAIAAYTKADPNNPNEVGASIKGMISKLNVSPGSPVKSGDVVAIIEAMKMETPILAKANGVVSEILVKTNQPVMAGELLLKLK